MRINQKVEKKMRLAEPKTKSKTCILYGPQEVHKSKRACAFCFYYCWVLAITKMPLNIISSLTLSRPHLISLLFTLHETPLTPHISSLYFALSVVSLSALSSV